MSRQRAANVVVSADDDDPPPKKPPKFCPWCGGNVLKRWTPNRLHSLHQKLHVKVTIAYVCLTCEVAVRACKFPSLPLFETKRAARAEAQRAYHDLEASGFRDTYTRNLYQRGKCACTYSYPGVPRSPCPIHAPLRRAQR